MKAWVFETKDDVGGWVERERSALPDLPVLVKVSHSGLNYKDALSLTRSAPISRRFPMVPGIDLVGTVIEDKSGTFQPGDTVVATGHGLGEVHWGGYSEEARLDPAWLLPLPRELNAEQAAAIGTAGLTAAMALDALERHGCAAGRSSVIVTGPTGGVGSMAVWLLAQAGYEVIAATGRPDEAEFLKGLGAREILARAELESEPRPLGKERWDAGVDVVGGTVLASILSSTRYGGAVAACGLAGSMQLPASVAPFILRGVSLLGVESVQASPETRTKAWARLARHADRIPFDRLVSRHNFLDVGQLAPQLLNRNLRGRVVLNW
jgi:acrylyl-CoA reductase (NADPH)